MVTRRRVIGMQRCRRYATVYRVHADGIEAQSKCICNVITYVSYSRCPSASQTASPLLKKKNKFLFIDHQKRPRLPAFVMKEH